MKNLEDFLRPTQKQLFKRLAKKFKSNALLSKGNFILVRGTAPVMLVAHLDTVHEEPVRDICFSADKNILMSPQGIGGDDRCGVFALVKIYQLSKVKPWLLFCCNEEVGGLGAKKFCLAHQQLQLPREIDDLKFIIELDRKGSRDAVYYHCDNPDFEEYISGKGFKTAQGSFSDISVIAPELGIAAVNLSCGYYAAHTLHEYINRSKLERTIEKILDIINDVTRPDFTRFDYVETFGRTSSARTPIELDESLYFESYFYDHHETIPSSVPAELIELYGVLLDFYSVTELESFRQEYGNQIIQQLYREVIEPYYEYPISN